MVKFLKGFSLIELMVVIAIIAVLAAVALPAYNNYMSKVRMSNVISYLNSKYIKDMHTYFAQHAAFPYSTIPAFQEHNNPYPGLEGVQIFSAWPTSIWLLAFLDTNYLGTPSGADRFIILLGYNQNSTMIDMFCGDWGDAGVGYIALEYLPEACQHANISDLEPNYH